MEGQNKSQQFETVAFTVNANEGYELQEVTIIDESGEPVEFTPMRGDDYSFVMPAAGVIITATFADAVTSVSRVDTAKAVQSVTYSDLAGRTSSKPFAGVNIVITRYTDGTVITSKQVR